MDDFLSVHFKIFLTNRITNKYNFKSNKQKQKIKDWCLINFFNGIKPKFY